MEQLDQSSQTRYALSYWTRLMCVSVSWLEVYATHSTKNINIQIFLFFSHFHQESKEHRSFL